MAAANERINLKHLFALEYEGNAVVLEWCMANGLIAKYYECPVCSREMKLNKCSGVDGFEWRCHLRGENAHDRRRSIRNGTWFARSHLSIIVVLQMTYMWVYKASNEFIKNEMAVNNHTVIDWKGFCREVCMDICVNESVMLGGENEIVEIDESKFGSRKYNRGKRMDDGWVFAGVQRGTNKCFMQVVQQRDKETLLDVIKKYIRPGTTVISDCWKAYGCLQDESFLQLSVNRSLNFKDPESGAHTKTIEGIWSAVKRALGGTNHAQGEFDSYLAEYLWRRSHTDVEDLFMQFLKAIEQVYTPRTMDE